MRLVSIVAAAALLALLGAMPAAGKGLPGEQNDDPALTISSPPAHIQAGKTWRARLSAKRGDGPLSSQNVAVTVFNASSGRAQTYYARETEPGLYVAGVVFPTSGWWDVSATGAGLTTEAPPAEVAAAPSHQAWPWIVAAAGAAVLAALVVMLVRRRRARG